MSTEEKIIIIENIVENYIQKNKNLIPFHIFGNEQSLQHVRKISKSILCTMWEIGHPGGSFVSSIINNLLYETIKSADYINKDCISFYVNMINNIDYPKELSNG
jgi:hypothetical protein